MFSWFGGWLLAGALVQGAEPAISNGPTNRFEFHTPSKEAYLVEPQALQNAAAIKTEWLDARREGGGTNVIRFGSRVVVQLDSSGYLSTLTGGHPLALSRVIASNIFVLQAPDALTAMQEAHRLAALAGVQASYPIFSRQNTLHSEYAPRSNDPFFVPYFNSNPSYDALWFLENRDYNGNRLGIDLNVLEAWPYTMGQGVTVAVADTGLDMNHTDLVARIVGAPHFNFATLTTSNATPNAGYFATGDAQTWTHATSIGGLLAATANNHEGMAGVAPMASLASWVIYQTNEALVPDEQLLSMFEYASNVVSIQNHSWGAGNGITVQAGPSVLEQLGIDTAANAGRNGLGTVMVRSAGNDRGSFDTSGLLERADDDGFPDSPEVIAVGAVVKTGRATSYSEPGACLLVGAPGGDINSQGLFTLDLAHATGPGVAGLTGDLDNYRFGPYNSFTAGFAGTSAAAPLVSGVAALIMSANTNLSYRDVQQIMLLSGHHGDLADPDVVTNGAGLLVSHNVGFGIPNAGDAVALARIWTNRPPLTIVSFTNSQTVPIPDEGLQVTLSGLGVPLQLASIPCAPATGPQPDSPTASLPMVDCGLATNVPAINLTNKGALILRGGNATFAQKIVNVAQAGAAFAIIYNTNGDDTLVPAMIGCDFDPIPAVFIGNSAGTGIQGMLLTNGLTTAQISLTSAQETFHVTNTMVCEQVGLRLQSNHQRRGDLRITLLSPMGTRSLLQFWNPDTNAGPVDWTYWTTHNFFESSAGDWTLSVGDETTGNTGSVLNATLIIRGTQITDTDHDGLDDNWELAHFGTLAYGPKDDPDGDGYDNAREQVMGTDPTKPNAPFDLQLAWWSLAGFTLPRITWPSAPIYNYQVYFGSNPAAMTLLTNAPGGFPETELLGPAFSPSQSRQFFKAYSKPVQ